jgi:RNA polymerase sigma-70 factor (ECF subfamily)
MMAMFGFNRRKQSVFESAVRAYSPELFRFAYWLCRDRALAEDLVQETFARAWKSWERLHDTEAVKHWLFTILRREHARLYERREPERVWVEDEAEMERLAGHVWQPDLSVREALMRLPESYRAPLLMQVLGGFSAAEIAAALGLTEDAVLARVSRARRGLRELLEPLPQSKEGTS